MMQATDVLLAAGGIALAGALVWVAVAWRRMGALRGRDLLLAVIPLFVFLIPVSVLLGAKGHCEDWDAARLGAAVAWAKGFPVYAGLHEGAIQTSMYPPGWLLAYAPTAIAKTPAGVMQLGNLLAPLYFLLPFLFLHRLLGVGRLAAFLALAALLFAACQVESLWWACFSPHADAPAIGIGLLAVLLLQSGERAPARRMRWMLGAAITAGLSVWCKQVMLPLLPALITWLLLQRQPRRALQFTGMLAVVGIVIAGISLCWAPLDTLWLNLVSIPGHHPWKGHFPFNLLKTFLDLTRTGLAPAIVIVLTAVSAACVLPRRDFGGWVLGCAWTPALLAALFLAPMSAMGFVKEGGALNSFSPAHYFLYAAAILQWVELVSAVKRVATTEPRLRDALVGGMAAIWWLVGGFWMLQSMQELRYGLHDLRDSLCQKAYAHLVSGNAPRAFFPAYPLAHLLAEGTLYHYVQGMADRDQAGGVPISAEQLAQHLPANAEVVCWTARQFGSEYGRGAVYFPNYSRPKKNEALPDFRCFQRAADSP